MLGGADNPNGELLSYIIGADTWAERKIFYRVLGKKFCGLFIYPGQSVRQVVAVSAPGDRGLNR